MRGPLSSPGRVPLRAWCLVGAGAIGLASLAAAYWFTHEPAPGISVRWRDGITPERRARLEREYLLIGEAGAYALLDTSRRNIEALVRDPDVADTHDIDREAFLVPFHVPYSGHWMWIAHRTPGLRNAPIRRGLIALLAAMTVGGLGDIWLHARRRGARASRVVL